MSEGHEKLQLQEDDVLKFLASGMHLGARNCETVMQDYSYARKSDGIHIINLRKTWEKLLLAARIIAGIENPADVCVISNRPYGTRAVLKFAAHTGASSIAGRFTPGTFTNQIQKAFREPRLLVATDPRTDHQAITEASYVNIPVISLCNTDSILENVDCAIPCNNKGIQSIGTMWWMLAREVLRIRGVISRSPDSPWEVMPDLYFYRDPEDIEKEEQAQALAQEAQQQAAIPAPEYASDWKAAPDDDWNQPVAPVGTEDWSAGTAAAVAPAPLGDEWSMAAPTTQTGNWGDTAEPDAGWNNTDTSKW